jgi:hypothetical protein
MVANNRLPRLVEVVNVDLDAMEQGAQFVDQNENVWCFYWDPERETALIEGGRYSIDRIVDCENSNKSGWQITVADVLKLMGYNAEIEIIWSPINSTAEEVLNTTVENLGLCQFYVL